MFLFLFDKGNRSLTLATPNNTFTPCYVTLMPQTQGHNLFQRDSLSCRVVSDYQLLLIIKRTAAKLHKYLLNDTWKMIESVVLQRTHWSDMTIMQLN